MLKLADNPPLRPASLAHVAAARGTWWVAHTKARAEKALAWALLPHGVDYFLPMVERVTFSGGRKRRGMQPLFGGYVFVSGGDDARGAALASGHVARLIPVRDQAALVGELGQLEATLDAGLGCELFPHLAVGRRCRVTAGPLANVVGVVLAHEAGDDVAARRVVLNVSVLGQGALVRLDPSLLEEADHSSERPSRPC